MDASTEYEKPSKIVVRLDGAITVERMNEKNAERTAGEPEAEERGGEGLTGAGPRAASSRRVAPRVCTLGRLPRHGQRPGDDLVVTGFADRRT